MSIHFTKVLTFEKTYNDSPHSGNTSHIFLLVNKENNFGNQTQHEVYLAMEVALKRENTVIVSERDAKIVQLISNGKTAKEAASEMGIKLRTMDYIINKLRFDLNCHTTSHLVATFLRQKLID